MGMSAFCPLRHGTVKTYFQLGTGKRKNGGCLAECAKCLTLTAFIVCWDKPAGMPVPYGWFAPVHVRTPGHSDYPTKFEGLEIKEIESGIIAEGPADCIESLINHVLKTNDKENSHYFEGDYVGLEVTLPDIFFRIDNSDVKNASRGFWTLFVASRDGQHPKTVPIPKIGVTLEEIYKILRG